MKKALFFVAMAFNALCYYSACQINCSFRYLYRKYYESNVNVGSYYGDQIGNNTLFAPTTSPNYIDVWTNTYQGSVTFRSGYEINEAMNNDFFNPRSIIATIQWSNGGYSIVVINKWHTNLKYITEQEVLYDNNTGNKINLITGNEKDERYWEFYF